MPRFTRSLPLAVAIPLALLTAACAPTRQYGALSPIGARVTNEAIAEDERTLGEWAGRLGALQAAAPAAPAPARGYAVARAAAWLAYARDAYAWDPRDGAADVALGEARRLVTALERDSVPVVVDAVAVPASRARPDLWESLERARRGTAARVAPAALADAELALVRATFLASHAAERSSTGGRSDAMRACEMQLQVATAERLLAGLDAGTPAALTVALQAEPVPAAVPLPVPALAPIVAPPLAAPVAKPVPKALARPLTRVVHFAVNSSELALPSRVTLGEVIAMLRTHPGVNLVIEGYTDARGNSLFNRELAIRRAAAVRRFLDGAGLALGRVTIAGVGADSTAVTSATAAARARDRRVMLSFTNPDGEPLTIAGFRALYVDPERDLQVERQQQQQRQQARRARSTSPRRMPTSRTPR